jgi:predicted metal-binding protein
MATAVGFSAEDLKETNVAEWKELVGTTRCSRCGGLLVLEQCFDLRSDNGQLDFTAKRCVQCGELVDPVILKNRRLRSPVC